MLYASTGDSTAHAEPFSLYTADIKICKVSADSVSAVLVEEERLESNVKELVLNSGQETGARPLQLGVCETSARSRHNLIS